MLQFIQVCPHGIENCKTVQQPVAACLTSFVLTDDDGHQEAVSFRFVERVILITVAETDNWQKSFFNLDLW